MAFGGVLEPRIPRLRGQSLRFWRLGANRRTSPPVKWNEFSRSSARRSTKPSPSVNSTSDRSWMARSSAKSGRVRTVRTGSCSADGQKLGQIMESYREIRRNERDQNAGPDSMTELDQWLTQDGGSISWEKVVRSPPKSAVVSPVGAIQHRCRRPQTKLSSSGWGFLNKPIDLLQNGVNFVAKMGGMIRFWYRNPQ